MPKLIHVRVRDDYLQFISGGWKPLTAIEELIWNGLDAEASRVTVRFKRSAIGGPEAILVTDDGHGLPYSEAEQAFRNLGGSWKRRTARTRNGKRLLHGKLGKGRFRAFHLGRAVDWRSWYKDNGGVSTYHVHGLVDKLGDFVVEDPEPASRGRTGMQVTVSEPDKNFSSLIGPSAIQDVAQHFGVYLTLYPDVSISYDCTRISPDEFIAHKEDIRLSPVKLQDGTEAQCELTIIEWKTDADRQIYLCDENGFVFGGVAPRIHTPRFAYTAYLKSKAVSLLAEQNALDLQEMNPDVASLLAASKTALKAYFRSREACLAADVVAEWKREEVYPYQGEAASEVEKVERQVFDICALSVNEYIPDFPDANRESRKFSFLLLRNALQTGPAALRRIFTEVLDLPEEKQEELVELIDKTSLEAVISASKTIANRLDFLRGLELLVFDPKTKQQLRERTQLHRIVAGHTWLFGEEFNLALSDRSLTEVLKKHLESAASPVVIDDPVLMDQGGTGVIDLMLTRYTTRLRPEERAHLVVELKRPSVKIDDEAVLQVRRYARAVMSDERFKEVDAKWEFWVLSNDMTEGVREQARAPDRRPGILQLGDNYTIWAKTWGEVVNDCKARLKFFQERLKYEADDESAVKYLRAAYEKYLPEDLRREVPDGATPQPTAPAVAVSACGEKPVQSPQ